MKHSRRSFLKGLSSLTAASTGALLSPSLALGAGGPGSNDLSLLVINIAGGVDMQAVLQRDFGALSDRRPTLFKDMSDTSLILPLTGTTGIHSRLAAIKSEWDLNNVAIINRVGYENSSRSHAEAEFAMARGVADRESSTKTGWLSRLGAQNFSDKPFALWDFSGGHRTTQGPYKGTEVTSLSSFALQNDSSVGSNESQFRHDILLGLMRDKLELQGEAQRLQDGYDSMERAIETVSTLPAADGYPSTSIGRQLRDFERVLHLDDTKIGYTRVGGYDTHDNQEERLNTLLTELNEALTHFIARMKAQDRWQKLIIYFTSEFSRTLTENGTIGTDHGAATDALIISPVVVGGEYGPLYTNNDFLGDHNWLPTGVNVANVYAELIQAIGFDPVPIVPTGSANLTLFG